ncbi:hypothetical protein like AT4G29090 [Hibiscus trionum]|uniref:Reverse transcriptase zinc-binding domain-containing protein n=1 Tax=Hibiscus trionum TaxID=183268 RepID=A0A9W7IN57_HIBTR|nr:hypothetical protein like AT4G29090 [Hibiscus trionum]
MQSTRLPRNVCDELELLIRNFIWGHSSDSRGVHPVNWGTICSPVANGGFGFKNLGHQHEAFLLKLVFAMISALDKLWVHVLRAKYHVYDFVSRSLPNMKGSWLWKGVCLAWEDVRKNLMWNLGDGNMVDFWDDSWVDTLGSLRSYRTDGVSHASHCTLIRSMVDHNREWRWSEFIDMVPPSVVQHIEAIKPPNATGITDLPDWSLEPSRRFMVNSAYRLCTNHPLLEEDQLWLCLSKYIGLPRV